jgi:hypothetical protein
LKPLFNKGYKPEREEKSNKVKKRVDKDLQGSYINKALKGSQAKAKRTELKGKAREPRQKNSLKALRNQ